MIYILINAAAIAIAAWVGLGAGLTFYMIFDKAGSKLRNLGPARIARLAIVAYLAQMWLASILAGALILAPAEADATTMALASAVVIWIGFVAPVIIVTHLYRSIPARMMLLDCAHWLIVMIIQTVMLTWIGLNAPPLQ